MTFDPIWWLLAATGALTATWLAAGIVKRTLRAGAWWRLLVTLLLVGLASVQPRLGAAADQPDGPVGQDVLLVIDRTTSMGAEDYGQGKPRMQGVAADIERLVSQLGPARYSVIVSDNESVVALPWTTDSGAVVSLANTVGWRDESYGTGSDIAEAEPLATQLLADDAAKRPQAHRLLVYFGDGEQTGTQQQSSFAPVAQYLDQALVLGYGTAEGAAMRRSVDSDEYVTRDSQRQLSHLDEDNLTQIADELGGAYEHRTSPDRFASSLPTAAAVGMEDDGTVGLELAWIAAAAALVPLLWGLNVALRERLLAAREAR